MKYLKTVVIVMMLSSSAYALEFEWDQVLEFHVHSSSRHRSQLILLEDGGYLITNGVDVFRLDSEFNELWDSEWLLNEDVWITKVLPIGNNSYLTAGRRDTNIILFEFNDEGDSLRFDTFEVGPRGGLIDIIQCEDGGLLLLTNFRNRYWEYHLIKISTDWEIVWDSMIQRPINGYVLNRMFESRDGDYYVGGEAYHRDSGTTVYVLKIGEDGDIIWSRQSEIGVRRVRGVISYDDDKMLIVGEYGGKSFFSSFDYEGELLNYTTTNYDYYQSPVVEKISDDNFLFKSRYNFVHPVTRRLWQDHILTLYTSDGDSIDSYIPPLDTLGLLSGGVLDIVSTGDGGAIILSGVSVNISDNPNRPWWVSRNQLVRLAPIDLDVVGDDQALQPKSIHLHEAFPNPFNGTTNIAFTSKLPGIAVVEIFDTSGRLVKTLEQGFFQIGEHRVLWKPESNVSGLYFAKLTDPNSQSVIKLNYLK